MKKRSDSRTPLARRLPRLMPSAASPRRASSPTAQIRFVFPETPLAPLVIQESEEPSEVNTIDGGNDGGGGGGACTPPMNKALPSHLLWHPRLPSNSQSRSSSARGTRESGLTYRIGNDKNGPPAPE